MDCFGTDFTDHEYAKRVADTPGSLSNWGGTQAIDRWWLSLKRFIPASLNRKKKTSRFSGLHPHIPLLLYQWAWGKPMCCKERVHQRFYTSCQSCFETVQKTPKKASEIGWGEKKKKHCKTWCEIRAAICARRAM